MRFENGRGMPLTIALAAAIGLGQGWVGTTRADGYRLHHTIPRTVQAVDLSTGQEFKAPPVPYGHYAKDSVLGCASCRMHKLLGCAGCGHGSGSGGGHGLGLFGHHDGAGSDCVGPGCEGGPGWGKHSAGRFAPMDLGSACVEPGCGGGTSCGHWKGKHHHAESAVLATTQSPPVGTAVVLPSGQDPCGQLGCEIPGKHHHGKGLHASRCGLCGGRGCGSCGGDGMVGGCSFCGGKGCSHCLSGLYGKLTGLLHRPKVDYFVGPGGPVPITPGYVPYVVPTRSPRDFFAFAPMNPFDR
jgi:hypothetical protein